MHSLAEDIGKKLALAEQVGAEGKVEESMKLMEEVRLSLFVYETNMLQNMKPLALAGRGNPQEEGAGRAGVPQLDAGQLVPAAEAARVRGLLRLPRHPRQRQAARRPLWRQAPPRLHQGGH